MPAPRRAAAHARRRHLAGLLAALACLGAAGCGSGETTAVIGEIAISPAAPRVALGETLQLSVALRGGDGTPLTGRSVLWSSADRAIAEVNQSGLVTPHAVGRVKIAASSEGQSAVVDLEVLRKRVGRVTLSASSTEGEVGDTLTVTATVRAADDEVLEDRDVSYTSSAPDVATVDAAGRVIGRGPGSATITGAVDGVSDQLSVRFTPRAVAAVTLSPDAAELTVGATVTLRARALDRTGAEITTSDPVTFASESPGIARVSAEGVVTGVGPGTAIVTATIAGVSGRATIRVRPRRAAAINVDPLTVSVRVGQRVTLDAVVRDADGNVLPDATIQWTSSASSIATVNSSGVVTGVSPGATAIIAESGEARTSIAVTVTPVPVASVSVSPSSVTLDVGDTRQLSATPRDADGDALSERTVTWTSSAPGVATVSSTGEVRALGAGRATITARSEGRSGTASVTVREPEPPEPPEPPSVPTTLVKVSGDTQLGRRHHDLDERLVVRVLDQRGRPMAGITVRWATVDEGKLTPATPTTDSDGEVSVKWELGPDVGVQTATATVDGVGTVTFSALAFR
ncbi:MAG TPA: Ig-like domain-containing protein [Gemmatimonadaceae bacterium]|nr:Ig-like domain-containing protein [Gemmatimonadaceae bacterium]